MRGTWLLLAPELAFSCGRSLRDVEHHATVTSAGLVEASAIATPIPSASGGPTAVHWHGLYKSTVGALYVPPEWKNVRWSPKESGAGVGEGPIALTFDTATGRVVGTIEGPLGPATIDGFAADGKLAATIARKDPADQGFTGTLVGSLGERGEGTMNLSPSDANAVRTVTFSLAPDGTAPAR